MRPPATGRPARTAPRSPRALVPVDAATQAPGPGLSPEQRFLPAASPTARRGPPTGTPTPLRVRPPQLGLHGALSPGTPSDPTVWGSWGLCRPPAGRPRLPATATGPAPARRRLRLGRPPLPMRPASASAPRQRNLLTAGPSARRRARTGHANALAHAPPAAWPAGRALPRHAHRPHCMGRSGPLLTAGWTARTPPATATGPAPAWRRVRLGRPPLPMRPARASTPRRLCRAASRKQDTGTGTRGQHLNRTRHASDCKPMFVLLCSRPCALPPPWPTRARARDTGDEAATPQHKQR